MSTTQELENPPWDQTKQRDYMRRLKQGHPTTDEEWEQAYAWERRCRIEPSGIQPMSEVAAPSQCPSDWYHAEEVQRLFTKGSQLFEPELAMMIAVHLNLALRKGWELRAQRDRSELVEAHRVHLLDVAEIARVRENHRDLATRITSLLHKHYDEHR